MIGFYDYTVVLTYISLMCSVFGITQAIGGHYRTAIICLALSGLFDMFDGKIARTKKNRTDDEKLFGVQIVLGVRGILGTIVLAYYCVCSVIRLGFFNVLETNRQRVEEGANKYYHGLPITTMAIVLPLAFMLNFVIAEREFSVLLLFVLAVVGTLFIVDFKLRKPSNAFLAVLVILVACAVIAIFLFSKYHISLCFPGLENSILDRLMR